MYYEIHTQELSHPRSFCISHNVLYAMHTCLLEPTDIYGRGGEVIRRVMFRDGEIDYFSEAHLRYAIPAIAFITVALIPPLLLIMYPLHYRVIAALKLDEKRWFKAISKFVSGKDEASF